MIRFAKIRPDKEADKLELLRVATLNGALITAMRKVDLRAQELAETMALAHGGEWQAQVDHQAGFVIVRRHSPE